MRNVSFSSISLALAAALHLEFWPNSAQHNCIYRCNCKELISGSIDFPGVCPSSHWFSQSGTTVNSASYCTGLNLAQQKTLSALVCCDWTIDPERRPSQGDSFGAVLIVRAAVRKTVYDVKAKMA